MIEDLATLVPSFCGGKEHVNCYNVIQEVVLDWFGFFEMVLDKTLL